MSIRFTKSEVLQTRPNIGPNLKLLVVNIGYSLLSAPHPIVSHQFINPQL